MLFSFKNLEALIRKNKLFLTLCLFSVSVPLLLIYSTRERTHHYTKSKTPSETVSFDVAHDKPSADKDSNFQFTEKLSWNETKFSEKEIQPEDFSKDPIIDEFQDWINEFSSLYCSHFDHAVDGDPCVEHDPRFLNHVTGLGERLAQKRRPIFSRIMCEDPEKALTLAVPAEIKSILPHAISQNIESWEEVELDNSNRMLPKASINSKIHHVRLADQRNLFFEADGAEEIHLSAHGNKIIGISLGDTFATSSKPISLENRKENGATNFDQVDSVQENNHALTLAQNDLLHSQRERRSGQSNTSSKLETIKRKILVVPARFIDETIAYESWLGGSNEILTNEYKEEILEQIDSDPYEPVTRANIQKTMDQITEFFKRNTDGVLEIIPVTSSVVTYDDEMPRRGHVPKTEISYSTDNIYDSAGDYTYATFNLWSDTLLVNNEDPLMNEAPSFHHKAIQLAMKQAEDWDYSGPAFQGIVFASIIGNTILDTNFSTPPVVSLVGGEATVSGHPHARFTPAIVDVDLDQNGDVTGVRVVDPGAYYGSSPSIFLNGVDYSDRITLAVDSTLASSIALSNYNQQGNGIGSSEIPAVYSTASNGELNPSNIAQSLGTNFGLHFANQYISKSELVLSDDAIIVEKGNPYSVMGQGDITQGGDLSIIEKHQLNNELQLKGVGYQLGNQIGDDIAELADQQSINNSPHNENGTVANTFRIYRSNFDSPPRFLREGNFSVYLPDEVFNYLDMLAVSNPGNYPFAVKFIGTGEEANGSFDHIASSQSATLIISDGGRGFVEEPMVEILDTDGDTILTLNASWIREKKGASHEEQANLVSYELEDRWIRGVNIKSPAGSAVRPASFKEKELTDYYVSFRSDIAENGVALEVTDENLQSHLLDATPNTPKKFGDAHLLIGSTYSDSAADIHITPIRLGGNNPMSYIECVINIGTVNAGEAKSPKFELELSNLNPSPDESVGVAAMVLDGNASQYAYSWFLNEEALASSVYLNQSAINLQFATPGRYVLRVVVSDMKGGVASRNVVITVQGDEQTNQSMLSGTVRSSQGLLQGARVVLQKAPVIEHNVSVTGSIYDSFFPDGMNNPTRFMIDGKIAPQLLFRRGEVHRFYFDNSAKLTDTFFATMSFLERPENTPPRIHINMLSDPRADLEKGKGYVRNPSISYKFSSAFSTYLTNQVGTYFEMLEYLFDQNQTNPPDINASLSDMNGSNLKLLDFLKTKSFTTFDDTNFSVTRPYARAIMQETNISTATVGPSIFGETGYVTYGGRGYSLTNIPQVEVKRSSIWEDYNNRDANATAFVDGVNTISPVIAEEFLGDTWQVRTGDSIIPNLVVWGSGGGDEEDPLSEVNASVEAWVSSTGSYMRTINIFNQGKGFEPNSTMAVLHYPIEPHAYWTFDRHETLFEDRNKSRYQPSPSWNREIMEKDGLKHYWSLDDNDSGITDKRGQSLRLESNETLEKEDFDSWGLLGKALHLADAEINATQFVNSMDQNFTVSFWVKPEGDFDINLSSGEVNVGYNSINDKFTLEDSSSGQSITPRVLKYWAHLAFVYDGVDLLFYVNGTSLKKGDPFSDSAIPNLSINTTSGGILLDEFRVFNKSLNESAIRYLAGISFLDISGNKFHATPLGGFLTAPDVNMSSDDVPEDIPDFSGGSGKLGDSFRDEKNGKSLYLDGSNQYLDLENHLGNEFKLAEGTISVWIKQDPQNTSPTAPIFSLTRPYQTIENNGTYELSESGTIFSLELQQGSPRLAGFTTNQTLKDGEWSHLVATFPFVQFWINGRQGSTQLITSGNAQFEEASDLIDLAISANNFRIGRSYDRIALSRIEQLPETPPEAYFHGNLDDLAIYDRILTQEEVSYLYDLRMGRDQIPVLEAVVDAVGTVIVNEGGEGYRENPDLVFWYGSKKDKEDLETFPDLAARDGTYTILGSDINGSHGQLVYIEEEESVYSLHIGKDSSRTYDWRADGVPNGWRKLISAAGLGEYESASLGDVVWAKRMDGLVDVPMPDGRLRKQRLVDYVTMDANNSFALERNATAPWPQKYFKPNGLYGFVEKVDLVVEPPETYNPNAPKTNVDAEAFVQFYIDQDANESITIIDPGVGISYIHSNNIKISGPGYQPSTPSGQKEQDYPGIADIDTDTSAGGTIRGVGGTGSIYDWSGNEDVNVSLIEFNKTYLSVAVENPGFGYAPPVEFKVFSPSPMYDETAEHNFSEAEFAVSKVSADGSILEVSVTKAGHGYVPGGNLTEDDNQSLQFILGNLGYSFDDDYPFVLITGGGGHGAYFKLPIETNGSILKQSISTVKGGTGYENVIPNNFPTAVHTTNSLAPGERNASLEVLLGGYLKEIPICERCKLRNEEVTERHKQSDVPSVGINYSHWAPWIEIWDRGRSEEEIDGMGSRAHATAKVENGNITKIIVTNSGAGYIDPVAIVRDAPSKHHNYHNANLGFRRKWKCTFERTLPSGEKVECAHVHWSLYPPENCPGETDNELPYEDVNGTPIIATGEQIRAWKERFNNFNQNPQNSFNVEDVNTTHHLNAGFLTRKCWGTKMNFVLHDDAVYRNPRADWEHLDAKLKVISKNGKIREIRVMDSGSNYYTTQIEVEGTGAGVDAIPIFDEYGLNTKVIFDDPRVKNLEFDLVNRPLGAGQGFRERPWAGDEHNTSDVTERNDPLFGDQERVEVLPILPLERNFTYNDPVTPGNTWNFGQPILADYLGDRILQVEILDPGLYGNSTNLEPISISYDPAGILDKNRDGLADFIPAEVKGIATTRVTRFVLDDNGSYDDTSSPSLIERGLFTENPRIQILDTRNLTGGSLDRNNSHYEVENASSYIRLNDDLGVIRNSADPQRSYLELFIDDRFPSQLYYGEGVTEDNDSNVIPAFGGEILVTEGVPGGSWGYEEAKEKPIFSYTDENGYYAFSNLSHGLYNVAVFLEDQKLQESTFRPTEKNTLISQYVYLPGFPDLVLQSNNYGQGQSTLIWSKESRILSRSYDFDDPLDSTFKSLTGIGRGFSTVPELIIIPDEGNFVLSPPEIEVTIEVDGSLNLKIIDTETTSKYFPGDKFTVRYSSTVSGIDFLESYLYSESNQTFQSGTLSSWEYNDTMTGTSRYQSASRLVISPDDGDGTNILEAVLSTSAIGEVANVFRAQVFEANGTEINASNVEWKVSLDFNSSEGEGNNTNIVQLEGSSGTRDLNTTGDQIELYLHSRLREYSGSLHGIEVVQGGKGYRLFEPIIVTDSKGYGLEASIEQIVTETFYVSGGQGSKPFYKFTDSNNQERNFSDIEFIPGHTYKFVADDINTSHPFMIGEREGDMDSSLVTGSPLAGKIGEIVVSIPSSYADKLVYFCTNHQDPMTESVDVNVTETFTVSGGDPSAPFFTITDSDGNNNEGFPILPIKLSAGKTYKFKADGINTSHPFMIGERTGDMDSLIVSGGPITGSNGEIIVAIPDGYQGELFYFCVTHDNTMNMAFDINETDVNTLGEISKVAVSNRGYGYTYPMEIRVSGSGGNGALLEPILPQGHLVLEANFTMTNGQVLNEQVKIKASDRQVLSSQEKWMDLYLDSFLDRNESWWERELNASNIFEDIDDDNLTNFDEWRFGSNPLSTDTDLDDLNDSTEHSFASSPIRVDTDNDGLTDYKEWSWSQNPQERPDPRNPDSDGDGLLDGEDKEPKNPDGVGVLSGRIIVQKRYSQTKYKLFYRFAEANEASKWNDTSDWLSPDDENWTGGPNFFYQDNLLYDRNYTIQAYLELKDLNESDAPNFNEGEPNASVTVPLNSNLYGIQLVPVDDPPQLTREPEFKDILRIDLNETNETAAYEWGLIAKDPYTPNDPYDMGSTPSNSVKIMLEGNFTEYLIDLPENNYEYNSTMLVDLDSVPTGIYSLTYKALDNFENYSDPVEQTIIVSDIQPPFLTIIDFVNNTGITTERKDSFSDVYPDYNKTIFTFLDQNNATADLNWSIGIPFNINDLLVEARDNKSGAVTWELSYDESLQTNALNSYELNFTTRDDSNNLSILNLNLNIIDEQVPEVFITGSSIDSKNTLNAYRGKGFYLEDKVQIFADDSFQAYQPELLNFEQNRSSFQVNWDGLSVEFVDNKTFVVPGDDSNYTITFSYSDPSGNTGSASLVLMMEDSPWEISGKAIDGYLKGSLVRFIKNGDGPVAISDEEGNFTLFFSEEELQKFDLDANGIISSSEGTIVVSGGIDVDTNASFLGELRADAESKIVSPITSVLTYMISQGDLLEDAEARLLEALGLSPDLDLRTYDPYAVIDKDLNNSVAAAVLLSNLRIANIINIPEAILSKEGGETYRSGQISQTLFIQIAQNLRKTTGLVDLQTIVDQVLPIAIDTLALSVVVTEDEISAITEIIGKADPQSLQSDLYSVKETLIGSQMWVKDNIFDKIAEEFSVDIVELDDKLDPISLVDVENLVSEKRLARRSNLYSPSGKNFKTFFSSSSTNKDCLWELETFDADGDTIYHSLLAGNFDFDGDGQNAFVLKPDGRLCLQDYDDIRQLAGTTLNLEIKLDDLRGGKSLIQGEISVKNLLALDSSELDDSWHHSDWFGSFYSGEGSWIYHHPMGWLYIHPDEQGGFWFWDHKWDFWWWSKKQAFPWIYRDDSTQWDYLMVMPDGVNVFDLENRRWRRRE